MKTLTSPFGFQEGSSLRRLLQTAMIATALLTPEFGRMLYAQDAGSPKPTETAPAGTPAPGKEVAQSFEKDGKKLYDYWLFLPADYNDSTDPVPLILFLHGAGESGMNLDVVKKHGPPKLVAATPEKYPFIVVSPQASNTGVGVFERWSADDLLLLLDDVQKKYRVDPDRIYLTGLSMGGFGSWRLAAKAPGRFAAVAPICGGGDPKTQAAALRNVPIWAFHGDKDPVVPLSRTTDMIDAIKAAGGEPILTVYLDVQHDSWTETYANPELYDWFLSHKRSERKEP